jgi:hypothetical protein
VLEWSDETPSLAVALSSITKHIDSHIDTAAASGVHWGARLALTAVLSHFPELGLLGSGYNTDLMKDEMEVLWTRTPRASESLSPGSLRRLLAVLLTVPRKSSDNSLRASLSLYFVLSL